ncbi:hypothetical protein SUDANB1_05632 [Streptomyces sp. enrichment culture]|uniref:hypothetical protein n=1 Tax=Streptomyces sp. enrichment culture TaxID=1795815 RepID=UPI003F573001
MLYVIGDRVRTLVECPPGFPGAFGAPKGTLGTIDSLPGRYTGYGVVLDGNPSGLPDDFAANEIEAVTFRKGDKIICPDMTLSTVDRMAPRVDGEPLHVITENSDRWPVAGCLRANWEDLLDAHRRSSAAAERVRTDPDPDNPKWKAALAELSQALDFLRIADPNVRIALAEDDARTAVVAKYPSATGFAVVARPDQDEPLGWSFRVGHGAITQYGVVPFDGDTHAFGLYTYRTKAERALIYSETPFVAARRLVRRGCPSARDFQPVTVAGEEWPRGWTFSTGRGPWARYGAVTVMGKVLPCLSRDRAETERRLTDDQPSADA